MQTERNINEQRINQAAACHTEQQRLRALYPWAILGQTSKNCKKLLQQTFPGIKFSVTLDKYSGGSTLQVRWDLGPSPAEVEVVVKPFQAGYFNGLEDIYEYARGPERQAWSTVLGDAKFLSVSRTSLGNFVPYRTRQLEQELATQLPFLVPHWFEGRTERHAEYEAERLAETIVYRTSFPAWFDGTTPWRLERVTDGEGKLISGVSFDETWRIVLEEASPAQAPTGNSSVSVTENPAKNGVEIRFSAKPSPELIAELKAAGFRWSKFQSLWYARRSPETLAFAYALLPS